MSVSVLSEHDLHITEWWDHDWVIRSGYDLLVPSPLLLRCRDGVSTSPACLDDLRTRGHSDARVPGGGFIQRW
jgi:hypothetical protein